MKARLQRILGWLRAGYPQGVPERDYIPLLAVLHRRLSDEEATQLGDELVANDLIPADKIDVAVGYLRTTDELASESELQRVMKVLQDAGWSVDEDSDGGTRPTLSPPETPR